MLRDFPEMILSGFLLLVVALLVLFSDSSSTVQEETVHTINQAVRSSAMSNADHSSRVEQNFFTVDKEAFEEEVIEQLVNSGLNLLSDDYETTFDYLESEEGSLKAVRVVLNTNDREFQSTAIVDFAE